MDNNDKVLIGKITSSHGVRGQVKIMSFAQNPVDIDNYNPIFDTNNNELKIKITSKAQGKNSDIFIVTISGISDKNHADDLKNTELFINKDQLSDDEDGEFYYTDLIGLKVINNGDEVGKVIDVVNYGAGDIIEIEFDESQKRKEKIEMFSLRDDIFPEINVKEGFVKMTFPDMVEIK